VATQNQDLATLLLVVFRHMLLWCTLQTYVIECQKQHLRTGSLK